MRGSLVDDQEVGMKGRATQIDRQTDRFILVIVVDKSKR